MMRGTAAALAAILVLAGPVLAQTRGQQPMPTEQSSENRLGVVLIRNEPVFALAAVGDYSPEERAEEVRTRLLRVIAPEQANQTTVERFGRGDIVAKQMYGSWIVSFKNVAIATVTPADMRAHRQSGRALAEQWTQQLQTALIDHLDITPQTAYNQVATQFMVAVGTPQQIAAGTLQGVPGFSEDERLAYEIRGQLARDPALAPLEVDVRDGVVTIRGAVPDSAAERRALDAIENLEGVEEVRSDLRIEGE